MPSQNNFFKALLEVMHHHRAQLCGRMCKKPGTPSTKTCDLVQVTNGAGSSMVQQSPSAAAAFQKCFETMAEKEHLAVDGAG